MPSRFFAPNLFADVMLGILKDEDETFFVHSASGEETLLPNATFGENFKVRFTDPDGIPMEGLETRVRCKITDVPVTNPKTHYIRRGEKRWEIVRTEKSNHMISLILDRA